MPQVGATGPSSDGVVLLPMANHEPRRIEPPRALIGPLQVDAILSVMKRCRLGACERTAFDRDSREKPG